jgi:lipoprotein-releasing system permease protein
VSNGAALFFARRILGFRDNGSRGTRYLRGAIVGVALSMVPLVVVMVVSDSMIEGITDRYIEVGTYHLQVKPYFAVGNEELEEKASLLRKLPGIKSAFPELQNPGVAIMGSRTAGVALRAVDDSFLEDPGTSAYLRVNSGEAKLDSANQILLGEALARNLGAKVGDIVSIATTKSVSAASSAKDDAKISQLGTTTAYTPKISAFKVRGIVSAGYRELDALWAFVSLRAGQRISSPGVTYSLIGIKVDKPYADLASMRASIESSLAADGAADDWSVLTWPEAERNVYKSFSTTKAILLLVMAIAVAVAAINVSSALVMLVLERRRDIAILKSSGASPGFIGRVFVIAGLGVGACGTLIGIAVGALLSWRINDLIGATEAIANAFSRLLALLSGAPAPHNAIRFLDPSYYLERIPVSISLGELFIVAATSLLLCLIASLVPAGRASRLPPLDIFRKT